MKVYPHNVPLVPVGSPVLSHVPHVQGASFFWLQWFLGLKAVCTI